LSPVASDVRETYEVLAKLAEGGMGAIYQVRHRHLDQLRVIKVMKPQLGGGGDFQARFLREARLEAQLQHPNIAQLHEFEVTPSGVAYMVIEYIEGVTLKEALDARGPLTVGLTLEVGRQALEALAYLHECGFVHRDISPDNLMFCRDATGRPVVKVIDLGIAKKTQEGAEQRITVTGTFLGKVHYASPEQFRGSGVDWRTDIYSFGIVLYELLTGEFPIRGKDTNTLIASHLFEPPKPFAETDPDARVPEPLRRLVLQALEKDPAERFPSTADFARRVAALQEAHPFDPAEIDQLLAVRREPAPLLHADAVSILGTTPAVSVDSPTVRIGPDGSLAHVTTTEAPWTTRVFGSPGVPRLRRLALGGVLAALLGIGLASFPWPSRDGGPAGREAPSAEELQRADAALVSDLDFGTHHALVVGNDAYVDPVLPRLESAVRDAQAVADLLETEYGFRVTTLFDATRADLFGALGRLRDTVGPQDSLLVYYAGHGTVIQDSSPYWQLADATAANTSQWVAIADVNIELADLRARHVLVVADSCYSGTAGQVFEPAAPPARSGAPWAKYVTAGHGRKARLALSSGRFEEVADRALGSHHSPFAQAFLELLRGNDRLLDAATLHAELTTRVTAQSALLGLDQSPVYTALPDAGDDGGSFFFVPNRLKELST
jgi:serine/threonine protein kinase